MYPVRGDLIHPLPSKAWSLGDPDFELVLLDSSSSFMGVLEMRGARAGFLKSIHDLPPALLETSRDSSLTSNVAWPSKVLDLVVTDLEVMTSDDLTDLTHPLVLSARVEVRPDDLKRLASVASSLVSG